MPEPRPGTTSIAAITVRRSMVIGARYLAIGSVISLFLTLGLLQSKSFTITYPLEVPIFATTGSIGALMVFVNDRSKGVFEYLISYGIPPRSLFGYALLSTAALASIVLGVTLAAGLGGFSAESGAPSAAFLESIAFYSVPMTFACSLFAAMTAMVWSAVSSPRAGMNSPVGFAPMLGIAPVIFVLIAAESVPRADYFYVTTGAALAVLLIVASIALASGRLMNRERFLSPM
jgi:hypothetical protein